MDSVNRVRCGSKLPIFSSVIVLSRRNQRCMRITREYLLMSKIDISNSLKIGAVMTIYG